MINSLPERIALKGSDCGCENQVFSSMSTSSEKELDKDFAGADAWRTMLAATNDDEVVEMRVRRMNADEARRARTSEARRENGHRATSADAPGHIAAFAGR
jgi:hypothetical protein